jgi:hypothetical protein
MVRYSVPPVGRRSNPTSFWTESLFTHTTPRGPVNAIGPILTGTVPHGPLVIRQGEREKIDNELVRESKRCQVRVAARGEVMVRIDLTLLGGFPVHLKPGRTN